MSQKKSGVAVLVLVVVSDHPAVLQVKDDVKFDLTKLAAGEMFCVNCPSAAARTAAFLLSGFKSHCLLGGENGSDRN